MTPNIRRILSNVDVHGRWFAILAEEKRLARLKYPRRARFPAAIYLVDSTINWRTANVENHI